MDYTTLVTLIKGRLKNSVSSKLDPIILRELNLLQETLEGDRWLPSFLQTSDNSLVTVTDSYDLAYPTGFIREISEGGMWLLTSGRRTKEILKNDFDYLTERYGTESGEPAAYAQIGGKFQIFPRPDAVYSLELFFYAQDDVINGTTIVTNKWLTDASDLIIGELGMIIAGQYSADVQAVSQFSSQAVRGRQRLILADIADEEANRVRLVNP
jgi:hypothetical protein